MLLILAGVTIGTLTGENSTITKAQEAKKNQEISQEREIVELSAVEASERDKFGEITKENLKEALTNNIGESKYTLREDKEKFTIVFTDSTSKTEHYVWKDMPVLTNANVTLNYNPNTWTNGNVMATVSTTADGYLIQTSQDNKMWSTTNQQIFNKNGTIYVRLINTNGQYSRTITGNVTNIDKTKPIVTNVIETTNSIKITATDEASGIIGYAITTENSQPNSYIPCNNTKKLVKKIENLSKDTQYYIWIKDEAGNVTGIKARTIVIKTGDYVIYEPGNREYTVSSALTGSETDQTFNTQTATNKWQVLYNDATYGLQITSSKLVINLKLNRAWQENGFNHNLALGYSRTAYNNAITVINTVSSYYANGENAVSARSIGSDPKNPTDRVTSYIVTATRHNKVSQPGVKIGDEYYLTDYNAMKNATSQNSAGIVNIGSEYYLASRGVKSENEDFLTANVKPGFTEDEQYHIRTITEIGKLYGLPILANTTGAGTDYFGWHMTSNAGIRPVVKLRDGLKVVSGAGTNENPYILK